MADELARWAAERASGVLARAEADAVAILRDALVGGVLRQRERGTTPSGMVPRPEVVAESERESGEVLWTYCVLTADEPVPASLAGVVASNPVERVDAGDLTALVSRVPPTATTLGRLDGALTSLPASPVDAVTATPGWS